MKLHARFDRFQRESGRFLDVSRPNPGPWALCRRTYPRAMFKSLCRAIQRLESANNVCSCAVFFIKPR